MIEVPFHVVNIVGSGELPIELALGPLGEDLKGEAWENEEQQPGLHHQMDEESGMTTFYRSGKFIIVGVDNLEDLYETEEQTRELLADLGALDSKDVETNFEIANVVGFAKVDRQLNLNALAIGLGLQYTEYEPEQFPALVYKNPDFPCKFLLFANGKVVIPGSKSVDGAEKAFEEFMEVLKEQLGLLA